MLAETPIAAAASISPRPNTTGKSGNMSIREGARFIIYTAATEMERPVFCHFGKFAFRDECPGRADRGIGGRLQAIWLGAKAYAIRGGFNA